MATKAAIIQREPNALLPYGEAGSVARRAQRAWQLVLQTELDDASFVRGEAIAAEREQREATRALQLTHEAFSLHQTFILGAHRYALRWRVVGKTVVFKVRWVRKVLRPLGL